MRHFGTKWDNVLIRFKLLADGTGRMKRVCFISVEKGSLNLAKVRKLLADSAYLTFFRQRMPDMNVGWK